MKMREKMRREENYKIMKIKGENEDKCEREGCKEKDRE
jgi:hypothetical protein